MILDLIINVVNDKESNLIYGAVSLPKDMLNSHRNGKIEEVLDIMNDRMDIRILYPLRYS